MIVMGLASAVLGMVPSIATGMLFNNVIPGAQLAVRSHDRADHSVTVISFNLALGSCRIEGRMGAAVRAALLGQLLSLPLPFFRPYTSAISRCGPRASTPFGR